ncbi:MAG: NfeD family protein [Propionibacteriales bacterium]|nr:NfeD family protein [Propionibacteriales bacterium]
MDWLRDHDWQSWLTIGLLLAAAELATLDFTLLMLAVGALAGCLLAAIGLNVVVQVIVAAAVSVGMLGFVRPNIARRMHAGPTLKSGPEALVGKGGLVLERVTAHNGRVKLLGEVWSARALDEDAVIEPGSRVSVVSIDGATAVVFASD